MRILLLSFGLIVSAFSAMAADGGDAVVFTRATIYIESEREKASEGVDEDSKKASDEEVDQDDKNLNENGDAPAPEEKPEMQKIRYKFSVEIRPLATTRLDWFQALGSLKPGKGILLTLPPTTSPPIDWSKLVKPTDLIYIRANGVIDTILPDVTGVEITDDPVPQEPIRALLYLKSGTVDAYDLKPGNRVISPLFSPSPRVLQ